MESRNAELIRKYARPGCIGLCGTSDWIGKAIRKAQAPLTEDGHRSLWSHAFLFSEQRLDGHWWVLESDLDLRNRQLRLGAQENRADRYFDDEAFPNLAILDFNLDAAQTRNVQVAALDLLAGLSSYSLSELVGTLFAMHSTRLRRRGNLLSREGALYCSAMVQHCYTAAGIDLMPGVHGKNVAPQDLYDSDLPHTTHSLIRDLGISSLRRLKHGTVELLNTPVEDLF
ncbi:hypothetical protein ATCM_09410 [Stenotrophomonas sp. ATCM1_4]|jgi:hypothetical protein|uniref:Uncharacterized protein n=1 Tax=Stenotrophomonas capsici TaxID=3110230 RepID=A0ABU5V927_9GAMM|nr:MULTISPECIES: hypothetical protein [unclassified Stenotrophomonas]MEA5669224.1 hypothetical protein [Stenotrophomonas sp. MH1]TDB27863.1 hypothetical protein ATCM_09410 [Stenotrophomonas sp. ATCM1_4]